jgi:chemotaxis protein histidine kinase CheA
VLTQLVRNAVYHGIEAPDHRMAKGKDESGCITLSISLSGGKIVVQLNDDGKGLDFQAIRNKARSTGLVTDEKQLEDRNSLLQVLFSPGFSTAEEAGMHAGRGIGLNLVKDRVKEMKGAIKLQSEDGKGTTFRILIPLDVKMTAVPVTA